MSSRKGSPNSATVRQIKATVYAHLGTRCAACGRECIVGGPMRDGRTLTLGHVVSHHNGGVYRVDNFLPCCIRCQRDMGERDWSDSGAPMLVQPLPPGTPLLPDPGTVMINMEPAPWL